MKLPKFMTAILEQSKAAALHAVAIWYPARIIIATEDETVAGFSVATPIITSLAVDASSDILGAAVRGHLSRSKYNVAIPTDAKAHYRTFLDAAGFKNAKAHYQGARLLQIRQSGKEIIIHPSVNGGLKGPDRGFRGHSDLNPIHLLKTATDAELGNRLRAAWSHCQDNSA